MPAKPPRPNFIAHLTWADVERRLARGAAALLPVGAAAKEHGLHLPMNTDEIQAGWLSANLAERHDLLIWPALTYGHYPAFTQFPGSISLSRPLFTKLVVEIVTGIAAWKPKAIFILDTGISTIAPVDDALGGETWHLRPVHLRIHQGADYQAQADLLRQQEFGSHADELETSRMLAIAPRSVEMAKAAATPSGPFQGALTRANAPSGSYGDPTLATRQKGEYLIKAMLADLDRAVEQALTGS